MNSLKILLIKTIIQSYELEYIESPNDNSLGINFVISLSKFFVVNENSYNSERLSIFNKNSLENKEKKEIIGSRNDEKNEYLIKIVFDLQKNVTNAFFKSFLYEMINSKFKLKFFLTDQLKNSKFSKVFLHHFFLNNNVLNFRYY